MFIICADYTTNFVIWQGIMTHREDVFFLFPLLFLYITPYTFYFFLFDKRSWFASQRYFSARSEKYPKDTPKERGFRFPLSFGNLLPQTTQEGPAGPSWISPGWVLLALRCCLSSAKRFPRVAGAARLFIRTDLHLPFRPGNCCAIFRCSRLSLRRGFPKGDGLRKSPFGLLLLGTFLSNKEKFLPEG